MAGLNFNRDQLSFLTDDESIRKFEQLVLLVDQINTTSIDELQLEIGGALQKANEAIDRFYNIFGASIKLDIAGFNGILSSADLNVQLALDTLDDHNHDGRYYTETEMDAFLLLKAPLASPTFTGTVGGITKAMIGLPSVDDTSDTSKPVSTATQAELDLKANIASPSFTGNVSTSGDSVRIDTAKTPSSATATGTTGQIAWDADYIYACTATNTWKRSALATW
jgi:hypothetical protein